MNAVAQQKSNVTGLRVPPHSVEAEQALLASVISDNRVIFDIDWLTENDFYRHEHVTIWRRIQAMAVQSLPIDPVTLSEALEKAGDLDRAGGIDYLVELSSNSRGSSNAEHYANIIRERAVSRQIIRIGNEIADIGYDGSEAQWKIDKAQSLAAGVEIRASAEPNHIDEILKKTVASIEERFKHKGELIGLSTGFVDLDRMTCGLCNGDLVIVAGRPSMGKTTFSLNIADNAVMADKCVIMFSLEMPKEQINLKSISHIGGVPFERLRSGKLIDEDFTSLTSAVSKMKGKNFYIDDQPGITSAQLLSRARKIAGKSGVKPDLIIVDYIQIMGDEDDDNNRRVGKISNNLKTMARTLDCPVVAISQLNRSVESRPLKNRRPVMSDLRDSGAIEQDADVVIMMYRDKVYDEETPMNDTAEAIIRKQRNGPLGTVYLQAQLNYSRFRSSVGYTPPEEPQNHASGRKGGFRA
ncbi:replicative DNA helicase [Pseudohongiella sp. O18]|uniref:replicative DNA helicase n=1 Tax=Pseudohongiella sp. O18 TaxID=2904248 RepID=UPI001F01B6F1|nr:replicative DNA helicase [Pseudohongiella sp. O18]